MIHLPQDFRELLSLLNSKKVEYLIIGGYAVGLYGYIRATGDIDIWISNKRDNALKIIECLKIFGFDEKDLDINYFLEENQITRFGNPPLRIEFITNISGVIFEECISRREVVKIDDIEIPFINLDDLKKNKSSAGRYKDLDDLENLSS